MSTVGNINVVLSANSTNLRTGLRQAATEVEAFAKTTDQAGATTAKSATLMGTAMKAGALAVGVALAYSVVSAAKFEEQMRNVNSISQLSERRFQSLSSQVVELSRVVPQSASTLAAGLYDIASSGFQGAAGMTVLKASAVAATAGMSDTATAAKGITAVLNAYGLTAADAGRVSDVLFQTVNLGVITFGELSTQLGDVVGTAAAAKVNIGEVGAAVAAMTLAGITGAESTTSLNRVIQSLIQPSDKLAVLYGQLGYQSGAAALQAKGLHGVMEDIRKATGGNVETLLQLFPEIRAARGAFALMANDGKNYQRTFEGIADSTNVAGATQKAFNEQMKSLSNQFKLFIGNLQADAITLGRALLPVLVDTINFLSQLGDDVAPAVASAFEAITPAAEDLWSTLENLVQVGEDLLDSLGPAAEAIGMLVGGAVIGGIRILAAGLKLVSGVLADNKDAAGLAAAAVLAYFVATRGTAAATAALQLMGNAWVSIQGLIVRGGVAVLNALETFTAPMRAAEGGFATLAAGARSAFSSIGAAIVSPMGALTLLTFAVIGVTQAMAESKAEGEKWANSFKTNLDESKLSSWKDTINDLGDGLDRLKSKLGQQRGDIGEVARAVLDVVIPFQNFGDTIWDNIGKVQAGTAEYEQMQSRLEKLRWGLINAAQSSSELQAIVADPKWKTAGQLNVELAEKVSKLKDEYENTNLSTAEYDRRMKSLNSQIKTNNKTLDEQETAVDKVLQVYLNFAKAHDIKLPSPDANSAEWRVWGESVQKAFDVQTNLNPNQAALSSSLQTLSSDLSTTTEKLKAYQDALNAVLGAPLDLRDAQAGLGSSIRDLGTDLAENGLNLDVWSEKGSELEGKMSKVKDAVIGLATETAKQQGIPAATKAFGEYVDRIKDGARQAGLTEDQVNELVKTMGLTPEALDIALGLADPQNVKKQLGDIQDTASNLERMKNIKLGVLIDDAAPAREGLQAWVHDLEGKPHVIDVQADTKDADSALAGFQVKVTQSDGQVIEYTVDANTQDADLALEGFQVKATGIGFGDGKVHEYTIKSNAADVLPEVAGVQKLIKNMDGSISIVTLSAETVQANSDIKAASDAAAAYGYLAPKATLDANSEPAMTQTEIVNALVDAYGKKVARAILEVTDNATPTLANLLAIYERLGSMPPVNLITNAITRTSSEAAATVGPYYDPNIQQMDGGIVEYYARGGWHGRRHEKHVAQIAPPGSVRVWAEPETGGEAYIPLAPGKRERSSTILRQVAQQFGYGVHRMADGGMLGSGTQPATGSGGVVIRTTVNWNAPVYGDEAIRKAATDVIDDRDRKLEVDMRRNLSGVV